MRTAIILVMFTASLAHAGWKDYETEREVSLDAAGLSGIEIKAGAGSLEVNGVSGGDQILVRAIIQVPDASEDKALEIIEKEMVLELQTNDDIAVLDGYFDSSGWGDSPSMRLEVSVPERFSMDIEDSSGSIVVNDVTGNIKVDDSSGSIKMSHVGGTVSIEDGSGSINIDGVGGDVTLEDGSGSIKLSDVNGSVTIDDGSGSITIRDVAEDLIIIDDGSGSINYSNVQGTVQNES